MFIRIVWITLNSNEQARTKLSTSLEAEADDEEKNQTTNNITFMLFMGDFEKSTEDDEIYFFSSSIAVCPGKQPLQNAMISLN